MTLKKKILTLANWKGNKRIVLPKSGSTHMEAYLEIRRQNASKIWDQCMEILGEDAEKGMDNITKEERQGLKSLKKIIEEKEIEVCNTDKNGSFCILYWEEYIKAGKNQKIKDQKISLEESEEIQNTLNGHMRWWAASFNLGGNWNKGYMPNDPAYKNHLENHHHPGQ